MNCKNMHLFITLVFSSLIYVVKGSLSNIEQAQCSLLKAQVHLANMGVLLSSDISQMNGITKLYASKSNLYTEIANTIHHSTNANSIISTALKDEIKNEYSKCASGKTVADVSDDLAKFALEVLPYPLQVAAKTDVKAADLTQNDLKNEILKIFS